MKHHEYANLFPMLPDSELRALAADIAANGLQTPITTLDDMILDGRNRHRACEIAGVDPTFEEYLGGDPLGFVVSHNLHRRHLDESQRGIIAARMANLKHGVRSDSPIGLSGKSQSEAAALLNVGKSTIKRARRVIAKGEPGLAEMVAAGELSVAAAEDVAKLPADQQKQAIAGGAAGVKQAAKKSRLSKRSAATSLENAEAPLPQSSSIASIKYIPEDGMAIWATAKSTLDRILPQDTQREAALLAAKQYIQTRIEKKK
jgi:ParB-like chromosome segregation protein Spo0J